MTTTASEMMNICIRELYSNEAFLGEFATELAALHCDAGFMGIISSIAAGPQSEFAYAAYKSAEIQSFKSAIDKQIRRSGAYFNYPAYATIGDQMKKKNATQKSTAISVFYAMQYLTLVNKRSEPQTPGSGPAATPRIQESPTNHTATSKPNAETTSDERIDFRLKYQAQYRCDDGHYVRSKNEALVDNWLYNHNIAHAYEKAVYSKTQGINYCSDFYVPTLKLFIEIWGNTDEAYEARKARKLAFYQECGYLLLSIEDQQVRNLDDILSKEVLMKI